MAHPLASLWEAQQTKFFLDSADPVTVYYKPVRTGTDVTFDSFNQEGTDPADPTSFSNITENTPDPVTVSGKTHLDMHGAAVGAGEGDQQLQIGKFPESDALFTCLLSAVKTSTDPNPILTIFDNDDNAVDYIIVDKDKKKYDVEAVKPRGMGATPFVVDVFLKLTNREV